MAKKILWLSRHTMTEEQVEDLHYSHCRYPRKTKFIEEEFLPCGSLDMVIHTASDRRTWIVRDPDSGDAVSLRLSDHFHNLPGFPGI